MELKLINDLKQFDEFVYQSPYVHYMKTSAWARVKQKQGYTPHYIGFFDNNQLVGTALALQSSWLTHKYLYVPWGPCIDYQSKDVIAECLELLKKYTSTLGVTFLRIDPNVIHLEHDKKGNVIETGINNEFVSETIKECGFIHKGYGYAYNGSWTNRYTLVIDIDKPLEDIKKGFTKQRLTSLNRHEVIGVSTHLGTKEDLKYLHELEIQLSNQLGFKPNKTSYFEDIKDAFGDHARIYVTTIDLDVMIQGINTEINSKKYAKDKEALQAKQNEIAKASSLKEMYGKEVVVACGLFIYESFKSWDLYTYNHKAFNFIKPDDNLHYFAIQDMKSLGVTFYDMCGFSGVTNSSDPNYGLYKYKSSFGPDYIEQIGEFDYPFNQNSWNRFKNEKKQINRVKRKWYSIKYKKK